MHSITIMGTVHKNNFQVYCIEDLDFRKTFIWDPKYTEHIDNLEGKYIKVVGHISETYDDGTVILEVDLIEELESLED